MSLNPERMNRANLLSLALRQRDTIARLESTVRDLTNTSSRTKGQIRKLIEVRKNEKWQLPDETGKKHVTEVLVHAMLANGFLTCYNVVSTWNFDAHLFAQSILLSILTPLVTYADKWRKEF